MKTMNVDQIIETVNPSEVLVKSTNYLQCIVKNDFQEYQYCYHTKQWYEFKTIGNSNSPKEIFVKYIN